MAIKETLDRIHGVGTIPQWKLDTTPRMKVSVDEMKDLIKKSSEEFQKREENSKRKPSTGNESSDEPGKTCPKCGVMHWNVFPDGRKMCLKCHYLDEKTDIIACEFICSGCPDIIQAQGKDIEAAMKKIIPHKVYDPAKQCEGLLTFYRQVFPNPEPTPIPETKETEKRSIGPETVTYKSERCQHPKRDIFICNRCRDFNYCDQTYSDAIICLLISVDLKLKKLLERMPP